MIAKNHLPDTAQSAQGYSGRHGGGTGFETKTDPLKNESLLKDLEQTLQHLNTEQKTCIRMFYLDKKSYQTISSETGFNLLQVKSYIQNGKRNLRLLLEKKLDKLEE
jgi:RNA polymerase sigma-70 factor (ECF subfamily)